MRGVLILGLTLALAAGADAKTHRPAKPHAPAYTLHVSSHLAEDAQVTLDAGQPFKTPGYGSADTGATAGPHTLAVTSRDGVNYKGDLILDPAKVAVFQGKTYWCVNLLESELQPYSKDECLMEVSDRG
jgi:hypothetical protein